MTAPLQPEIGGGVQLETTVRFQAGLFAALLGVLIGRGLTTRQEMGLALDMMIEVESDALARELLGVVARMVEATGDEAPLAGLRVIEGGRGDSLV